MIRWCCNPALPSASPALSTALKDDRPDSFPMVRKSSSRRPSFCTSKIFEDVLSHDEHRRKGDIGNALFIVHAGMLKVRPTAFRGWSGRP